eukprot:3051582-Amphidinium_carterae.1
MTAEVSKIWFAIPTQSGAASFTLTRRSNGGPGQEKLSKWDYLIHHDSTTVLVTGQNMIALWRMGHSLL